jgi:hypothetical protein
MLKGFDLRVTREFELGIWEKWGFLTEIIVISKTNKGNAVFLTWKMSFFFFVGLWESYRVIVLVYYSNLKWNQYAVKFFLLTIGNRATITGRM